MCKIIRFLHQHVLLYEIGKLIGCQITWNSRFFMFTHVVCDVCDKQINCFDDKFHRIEVFVSTLITLRYL
jgi:hypothetical protein